MQIRRDDLVVVRVGNDAGKKGKILRIINKTNRVIVEGVNVRSKNLRKSQKNPKGGRVEREMSISMSNVMPFCSKCNKGVRVRHQEKSGKNSRVCIKCAQPIGAAK